MGGLIHYVDFIFKRSEEALKDWNRPVDLLFIDGAHDYDSVKKDFEYEKYLSNGGWVVFHDALNPAEGPARIFIEKVLSKGFSGLGGVDSILFAQKLKNIHIGKTKRLSLVFLLRIWLILTLIYRKLAKNSFGKRLVRFIMKKVLRPTVLVLVNN